MNAQDYNFWVTFALFGVPLIILFGGPFGWRALVLLGALAGLTTYPLTTIVVIAAYALRWLVADFFIAFIAGLGGGLGLRASGWRSRDERHATLSRRSLRDRWRGR